MFRILGIIYPISYREIHDWNRIYIGDNVILVSYPSISDEIDKFYFLERTLIDIILAKNIDGYQSGALAQLYV